MLKLSATYITMVYTVLNMLIWKVTSELQLELVMFNTAECRQNTKSTSNKFSK